MNGVGVKFTNGLPLIVRQVEFVSSNSLIPLFVVWEKIQANRSLKVDHYKTRH